MRRLVSVIVLATSSLLLSLVCSSVLHGNPLNSDDESPTLARSIDLRTLGYVIPTDERDVRAYEFMTNPVTFLDDGTLAVSFFGKNDHPGLSRRDGTPGGRFLFHSVLLNPVTGDVVGQRTWGNAGYWNSLLPLQNGNFFVQSNEWLMIYSKELREITRRKVEVPGDLLPRYSVSPSGRSLYEFMDAYDVQRGWLTTINLLDTITLEPKQSKLTPGHADETVSDRQVVYSLANPGNELVLFAYNIDGSSPPWGPMLLKKRDKLAGLLSRSDCKSETFIDNKVLAVTGDCPLLLLIESGKKMALLHSRQGYRFGGDVQPSRHSRRFAFVRSQNRGKSSAVGEIEVSVYDLDGQTEIFVARVAPVPAFKFAFALSPDGSLLAVQTDSLLRVWRLASPH
jgi:hypothetical protein